jgi:hypothetical protein
MCASVPPTHTVSAAAVAAAAAAGQRLLTFEVEVSRERVPLRNAYKAAGQCAVMRVNGGEKHVLPVGGVL